MSEIALLEWCREQHPGTRSLELVSGDASFRKYYRLETDEGSLIAVIAPPDREDNEAFVAVRQLLADHGVAVPDLLGWQRSKGFMLLQDFGDDLLLPLLNSATVEQHYDSALDMLQNIQAVPCHGLPDYGPLLAAELGVMDEWFTRLLDYSLSEQDLQLLSRLADVLIANANAQPQVLVHRDFHSRNIMILDDESLGIIDFQDAVRGAITYDLVSLLRDCYVEWPDERVRSWALAYRNRCAPEVDDQRFLRWFDLIGLQRHIKVLGVFARLSLRDSKHGYLEDLPLVIRYIRRIAAQYDDTREFGRWFDDTLLPRAKEQHWYLD